MSIFVVLVNLVTKPLESEAELLIILIGGSKLTFHSFFLQCKGSRMNIDM